MIIGFIRIRSAEFVISFFHDPDSGQKVLLEVIYIPSI